jgi:hypothetical protein
MMEKKKKITREKYTIGVRGREREGEESFFHNNQVIIAMNVYRGCRSCAEVQLKKRRIKCPMFVSPSSSSLIVSPLLIPSLSCNQFKGIQRIKHFFMFVGNFFLSLWFLPPLFSLSSLSLSLAMQQPFGSAAAALWRRIQFGRKNFLCLFSPSSFPTK